MSHSLGSTGKAPPTNYLLARKKAVQKRIRKSASGFVRIHRFPPIDKAAARYLIDEGVLEIRDTAVGKAYAFKDAG